MKKDLLLILLGMFLATMIIFDVGINIWQHIRITNLELFRNNLIASIQQNQQRQIRQPIQEEIKKE